MSLSRQTDNIWRAIGRSPEITDLAAGISTNLSHQSRVRCLAVPPAVPPVAIAACPATVLVMVGGLVWRLERCCVDADASSDSEEDDDEPPTSMFS